MPKPKNKAELETLAQARFEQLFDRIDQLPEHQREGEFPPGTMNRNVRDVLGHLHHWHLLLLDWYAVGNSGQKPEMPAPGYTWRITSDLNRFIHQKYRDVPLSDMRTKLTKSHEAVYELITKHTEDELFTKKRYPWTGSTSMGAYLISSTSSHYDWAIGLIKRVWR